MPAAGHAAAAAARATGHARGQRAGRHAAVTLPRSGTLVDRRRSSARKRGGGVIWRHADSGGRGEMPPEEGCGTQGMGDSLMGLVGSRFGASIAALQWIGSASSSPAFLSPHIPGGSAFLLRQLCMGVGVGWGGDKQQLE